MIEGDNETGIYIMPYKIQKQRLKDIQNSLNKKKFLLSQKIDSAVYIVSEYDTLSQVEDQLKKDGMVLPEKAHIVSMKWLVECLKASRLVPVEESHKIKKAVSQDKNESASKPLELTEWACQRGARLMNINKTFTVGVEHTHEVQRLINLVLKDLEEKWWQNQIKFKVQKMPLLVDALEILQERAELRDGNQDYSRALAFRRASCALKTFPVLVRDIHQLDGIKDIGGHARTVIEDIIDQGFSSEVEDIKNSDWFKKMKHFTGVFGVGPSTAKKWIDKGWSSIDDVITAGNFGSDWRISWGLAFFTDLNTPVSLCEATVFLNIVKEEAENLLPGVIVSLVGGFRRGKTCGHDVDILLSHPDEGKELGLLAKLLKALEKRQLILIGHTEKNSFRPDVLYQDFKLSMRGQLDHFEKWLGICKFPNSFQKEPVQDTVNSSESSKTERFHSCHEKAISSTKNEVNASELQECCKFPKKSMDESFDNDSFEPLLKKSRLEGNLTDQPMKLSKETREWTARRVDLIVSSYSQYFYALVGWTGSKHFNRDARLYAQKVLGMKLTSHGLFDSKTQKSIPAISEEEVFSHLNIPYRQPFERNC